MKLVTLTWNQPKNRWDMAVWKEAKQEWWFIMDFPPCENIDILFRPHKDRVNEYELTIKKTGGLKNGRKRMGNLQ